MSTATLLQSSRASLKGNGHNHSFTRHHTINSAGQQPASSTKPLAHNDDKVDEGETHSEPEYLSEASGENSEEEFGDASNDGVGETPESYLAQDETFFPPAGISSETRLSSWSDLDLSVVVALVSPIGHWLTGGDHIKNLFLIVLLIFYLHQLIQGKLSLHFNVFPLSLCCPQYHGNSIAHRFPASRFQIFILARKMQRLV
jgi:hypothetical protein